MSGQQKASSVENDAVAPAAFHNDNSEPSTGNSNTQTDLTEHSLKNLDMWNIDGLSPEFNFLNVPDDPFNFLQANAADPDKQQHDEQQQPPQQPQQQQQQQQQQHTPQPTTVDSPSTGTLFTHSKPSPSVNRPSPSYSTNGQSNKNTPQPSVKEGNQGNYLLNHYENILKQNKVSMKEALSPTSQFSPSNGPANSPSPGTVEQRKSLIQQQQFQLQQLQQQQNHRQSTYSNHPSPLQHSQYQSQPQQQPPQLPPQPSKPTMICDHCRRRQIKCLMPPSMSNCFQCEAKGIKCTYSESPSNPSLKRNMGVLSAATSPQDFSNKPSKRQRTSNTQPVLQYPRSSFFVGASSMFDSILLNRIKLDKIDQVQLSKSLSLRKVSPFVQFILRDDYTDELAIQTEKSVDDVENLVAPYGPNLIHLYFRIVHPYFPILHKKVFLEKYSRSYREFSAPLLATVYSLACRWWEHDTKLSKLTKPNVDELNSIALKSFTEVTERPRLSAVQAGLLLLDCRSENQNNWILMQQVVSLAEELGLGLDCQDWKLPKWERGLRRRLAWAVWIQEKWTALSESRVSHFKMDRNWMVQELTDDDFPEVNNNPLFSNEVEFQDIENGRHLFKEFVQLSLILNEILETFYTYSSLRDLNRVDEVLKAAKPLQFKLRQWYHSLPVSVQMNNQNDKLNSNGYLHLSYLSVEITLHRRIISSLANPIASIPPELIKVCRAAATTRLIAMIEFVKNLKTEHLLSFWHSSTTYSLTIVGTFASILYVSSNSLQESMVYKDHINVYRMILMKLSKSFKPAGLALQRIDTLLSQIPGLLNTDVTRNALSPYMVQPQQQPSPQQQQQQLSGFKNSISNTQVLQRGLSSSGNGTSPVTTSTKEKS